MRKTNEIRHRLVISAAALVAGGLARSANAQYLTVDQFTGVTVNAAQSYSWNEQTNWGGGVPTDTALASMSSGVAPQSVNANMSAYAMALFPPGDLTISSTAGSILTLISQDTAYNTTADTSPAIYSNTTGKMMINVPIQLGDSTTTSGTAYFMNAGGANGLEIGTVISEAPGQVWGITAAQGNVAFRGGANGSNYLLNRMTITGQISILAGADINIQNNIQPYGPGLPNYEVNGALGRGLNAGSAIYNAIDGNGDLTLFSGNGNATVLGANGGNGNFSGEITSQRIHKVGAGTQALGTGASPNTMTMGNAQTVTWVEEGAVSVTAMPQLGPAASTTTLDGGGLTYLGPGETTTSTKLNLSYRGGTLSASGSGPLVIGAGSTFVNTDVADAFGDAAVNVAAESEIVSNVYGLTGLSAFVGKVTETGDMATIAAGSSPAAINETARTIDLGAGNFVNATGSGFGAAQFAFTANQAIARTLVLNGSNTGLNTIGIPLTDEALPVAPNSPGPGTFGASLALTKSGPGTWVLGATNTYSGGTNVNAGTLVAGTATALPAGKAVTIGGTGTLQLAQGIGGQTFASTALTINSGGSLDLTNNHAFITYGGTDPATTILAQVTSGAAGGAWTGTGITSSTAATTSGYGVAYGDGADGIASNLTSGQIEVAYALLGDIKMTGAVNALDFGILAGNFGKAVTGGWEQGDLNYDGVVNAIDFGDLAGNFGKSATGTAVAVSAADWAALDSFAAANGLLADVPEPASIGLMVVAGAGILSRRRRKA